ncbi:MAG: hypothetical protein NXI31_24445 [bacterium]|nr:hypothetical protein [bacterium]
MGWSWPTTLTAGATLALMLGSSLADRGDARDDLATLLHRLEAQPIEQSPPIAPHRLSPLRATKLDAATCYENAFAAQRSVPPFSITALGYGRGMAGAILGSRLLELRRELEPCFRWLRAGATARTNRILLPPPPAGAEFARQLMNRVLAEAASRTLEGRPDAAVELWLAGGQLLCDYRDIFWLEQSLLPFWSRERLRALPNSARSELHHGLARLEGSLRATHPLTPWLIRHVRELLESSDTRFEAAAPRVASRAPWRTSLWSRQATLCQLRHLQPVVAGSVPASSPELAEQSSGRTASRGAR